MGSHVINRITNINATRRLHSTVMDVSLKRWLRYVSDDDDHDDVMMMMMLMRWKLDMLYCILYYSQPVYEV